MEDDEVMIIIKSKKPDYIHKLDNIKELIHKAVETERCIILDDVSDKLPSDAARDADISVGIGVSSAVMESVIMGCRGVHCDLSGHTQHPYYKTGLNRLIFNDIDELLDALKKFKKNMGDIPGLGDWSEHIQSVDPFRDGKGDRRIGAYLEWLFDRFDSGAGKDEAINYANKKYMSIWGSDKVIENRQLN